MLFLASSYDPFKLDAYEPLQKVMCWYIQCMVMLWYFRTYYGAEIYVVFTSVILVLFMLLQYLLIFWNN